MADTIQIDPVSGMSLRDKVRNEIRIRIRSCQWRPGSRLPSLRQISRSCGVSVSTVQQAIEALMADGYLYSQQGRGVYVNDSPLLQRYVSLILPALDTEPIGRLLAGVKQGLGDDSTQLLVQGADFDFKQEQRLISHLDSKSVAGAIIYPPPLRRDAEVLRHACVRGIPIVLVDTIVDGLEVDTVTVDRLEMGRLAAGHLLERGHRRLGVVDNSTDASSSQQMREGADAVLRQAGLSFWNLPRTISSATALDRYQPWRNGQQAAKSLLTDHPDVTAILAMTSHLALGALMAIQELGLHAGRDVALISMGNLNAFLVSDPPVTVIEMAHEDVGWQAAQCLLRRLGGDHQPPRHIRLSAHLVERKSVHSIPPGQTTYRSLEGGGPSA